MCINTKQNGYSITKRFNRHIYNRGNNKEVLFRTSADFHHFHELCRIYLTPIADIFAWCFIKNHFHFCLRIKEECEIGFLDTRNQKATLLDVKWKVYSESDMDHPYRQKPKYGSMIQFLFAAYTKWYNLKYLRTGSLFEKNFERILVEDKDYLINLITYINNNPVKHGLVSEANKYKWSSFGETVQNKSVLVDLPTIWNLFGDSENFIYVHQIRFNQDLDLGDF